MNTQMKLLAASCALVAANAAHALSPTIVPDYSLFMSGSSALQADLTNEIGGTLCQAGTVDMYLDAGGGSDFRMYTCTTSASIGNGVPAGKNLVVYLRANGGSFYGTSPVGSFAVGRYDPIGSVAGQVAGGCPASAPVTLGPTITGGANCTGWTTANAAALVKQIPDAGISDVEPALVTASANAPTSCTGLGDTACAPKASNYTTNPVLIQAFGVIASGPLQTALINAGSSAGGKANVQDRWLTDVFATTSGVYNLADWSALSDLVTSATGSTNSFSGSVILCRRAKGSGTQASFQARYMNVGCANSSSASQTVAALADSIDVTITNPGAVPATGYYQVYENSSSGAVISCVQAASSAGLKAVGLLSLDQQSSSKFNRGTGVGNIDFLAINGAAPTDATIANGSYPYMVESTVQVDNRTSGQNAGGVSVAKGLVTAMQTVTTVSPYGVYNVLTGTAGSVTGTAAPKSFKGSNGNNTCTPVLF